MDENIFENVICEMAAILSRPQCVDKKETKNGFIHNLIIAHGIMLMLPIVARADSISVYYCVLNIFR